MSDSSFVCISAYGVAPDGIRSRWHDGSGRYIVSLGHDATLYLTPAAARAAIAALIDSLTGRGDLPDRPGALGAAVADLAELAKELDFHGVPDDLATRAHDILGQLGHLVAGAGASADEEGASCSSASS